MLSVPAAFVFIRMEFAPASKEFSINSLITEDGPSITSPAAILLIKMGLRMLILFVFFIFNEVSFL